MWNDDETTELFSALDVGTFFADRFRIDAALGAGAMARVLAAHDTKTGNVVALKILNRDRAGDPDALARFRREAEILAQLGHPAIVQILEFDADARLPWLSMELLDGETLRARLARGPLAPREIKRVLDTACEALSLAHRQGVVHRDLKPDNIFLLASGTPPCKLLDFGLSRLAATKTLTQQGTILGTPRYMAPEQIRSAAASDKRVDVYALGVVLYEVLAGASPYAAEDMGQLLGCVVTGRVVPLASRRPDLPVEALEVVARAMSMDPDSRWGEATELAAAFSHAFGFSVDEATTDPQVVVLPFSPDAQVARTTQVGLGEPTPSGWPQASAASFTRPSHNPPSSAPVEKSRIDRRFVWAAVAVCAVAAALGALARLFAS
jgi:serine/threonine protein kinase